MNILKNLSRTLVIITYLIVSLGISSAQDAVMQKDKQEFVKSKVLEIIYTGTTTDVGTSMPIPTQEIRSQVIEGDNTGKEVIFRNDYTQLKVGEIFYATHYVSGSDDYESWSVSDKYRLDIIAYVFAIFLLLLFAFGGKQGARGLLSLVGSLFLIFYILVPSLYAGYNAILISIGVASLIIILGSYITHGFNRTTTCAVLGMITTVILTGIGAYYSVELSGLTGFTSEENTYLHFDTEGKIDMLGLLYGGIMIGLLGVLYDMAIGQAVSIEELYRANRNLTISEVYLRGLRIGREHIGALVNTLAIAYVGASLPLILLIQSSNTGLLFILNSEVFATEIMRILIGSIGLVLAVPITTLISAYLLHKRVGDTSYHGHSHSHSHSH